VRHFITLENLVTLSLTIIIDQNRKLATLLSHIGGHLVNMVYYSTIVIDISSKDDDLLEKLDKNICFILDLLSSISILLLLNVPSSKNHSSFLGDFRQPRIFCTIRLFWIIMHHLLLIWFDLAFNSSQVRPPSFIIFLTIFYYFFWPS
jgi:hypothetical protein